MSPKRQTRRIEAVETRRLRYSKRQSVPCALAALGLHWCWGQLQRCGGAGTANNRTQDMS
jgi:hypothetical protein